MNIQLRIITDENTNHIYNSSPSEHSVFDDRPIIKNRQSDEVAQSFPILRPQIDEVNNDDWDRLFVTNLSIMMMSGTLLILILIKVTKFMDGLEYFLQNMGNIIGIITIPMNLYGRNHLSLHSVKKFLESILMLITKVIFQYGNSIRVF